MYLAGRFQIVRDTAVAYWHGRAQVTPLVEERWSRLEGVDVSGAVARLKEEGLYSGIRLNGETLKELRTFCDNSVCFGNGRRMYPFRIVHKGLAEESFQIRFAVARYLTCLSDCSTLASLISDQTLLAIARGYLGAEPVFLTARMWWSFVSSAREGSESFHFDLDDYRAISFFFYLSDVDTGSGPHVCIRGSHRGKPLSLLISPFKAKSDRQIQAVYGPEQITVVYGSAGTGFAEDLFCFHKGLRPLTNDRLILQIRYGLRKYFQREEE
jgi:hypothetical protein